MRGKFRVWILLWQFLAAVLLVSGSDELDSFLVGPEYQVLEQETRGWHTYVTRLVQQEQNATYLESLDVATMHDDDPDEDELQFVDFAADQTNSTEKEIFKRSCGKSDSSSCAFVNNQGRVYFTMGLKYFQCDSPRSSKYKFRFSARYPGTYVIRFQNSRGAYVAAIRTYKGNQVVNFLWPWHRVHVGSDTKAFLLIRPDPHNVRNIFNNRFRWKVLDLEEILDGTVSKGNGDYNLIFRSRNVGMVEQMKPFDNSRFIKVGNCRMSAT